MNKEQLEEELKKQKGFYNQLKKIYDEEINKSIALKERVKYLEKENSELWQKVMNYENQLKEKNNG